MVQKPVVFISSTSDLASARDLVGKVLHSMGYDPVWQDIAPTDGGELLQILRHRIQPCSLVIQLLRQRYGRTPRSTPEFGRISYTQFEALLAEKLGKKVIYHFIDPAFPTSSASPESEECRNLQTRYQQRIIEANKLRQTSTSPAPRTSNSPSAASLMNSPKSESNPTAASAKCSTWPAAQSPA